MIIYKMSFIRGDINKDGTNNNAVHQTEQMMCLD